MYHPLLRLAALSMALHAQSPLGTVTGLVIDPSGATVPGAAIRLKNATTNVESSTRSNDAGVYVFANVLPGEYALEVEARGFQKLVSSPFPAGAYRTIRADLKIIVASVEIQAQVTGTLSPVIQSESPSIATSLSLKALRELPTNLRSVFNNAGLNSGARADTPDR